MRKFGRVDGNQTAIANGLRQIGCVVVSLASQGGGVPDLLVGFRGKNFLLEVKDDKQKPSDQKLTPAQKDFFKTWKGQCAVVKNLMEAAHVVTTG
jgi:hypothetical protein